MLWLVKRGEENRYIIVDRDANAHAPDCVFVRAKQMLEAEGIVESKKK